MLNNIDYNLVENLNNSNENNNLKLIQLYLK